MTKTWLARAAGMPALAIALIAASSLFTGCSGSDGTGTADAPEAVESGSETGAPSQGSSPQNDTDTAGMEASAGISGTVTYAGEPPRRRPLDTEADPACAEMHMDEPLLSDEKVVGEDGGVNWAFAYVKNPPEKDYPVPETPAVLDQVGCRYTPHVMGARAEQTLDIRNSDETTHNVRSFSNRRFDGKIINTNFNFGQPGPGVRQQVFENPEMAIKIKCDIHPWMQSYVFAMEHPYFDTTNADGRFVIPTDGLPAGEYTVVVWHEAWGELEQTVTLPEDGASAEVNFEFSAE